MGRGPDAVPSPVPIEAPDTRENEGCGLAEALLNGAVPMGLRERTSDSMIFSWAGARLGVKDAGGVVYLIVDNVPLYEAVAVSSAVAAGCPLSSQKVI